MTPQDEMIRQAICQARDAKRALEIQQVRQARRKLYRSPWPRGEQDPGETFQKKSEVQAVVPYTAPKKYPPPPPPDREDPPPPIAEDYASLIRHVAKEVGHEVSGMIWNPYLFPTPYSQDFDEQGTVTIAATATRTNAITFQVPSGHVGVLEGIATDIAPALQSLTEVHPTINKATMKNFERAAAGGYGAVKVAGLTYPIAPLTSPRRVMHPLQEEMFVGIDFNVLAGGAALLPASFTGLLRGRYWSPAKSTWFWSYAKSA